MVGQQQPHVGREFRRLARGFPRSRQGQGAVRAGSPDGPSPRYGQGARLHGCAWHSLFIRNLLIRPPREDLAGFVPDLTIVDLPSFRADPKRHGARSETVIARDFTRKIVLIGGTSYAGEMKKSVFTFLNYVLPKQT